MWLQLHQVELQNTSPEVHSGSVRPAARVWPKHLTSWTMWNEAELRIYCPLCCYTTGGERSSEPSCTETKTNNKTTHLDSSTSARRGAFELHFSPSVVSPYNDPEIAGSISLSLSTLWFLTYFPSFSFCKRAPKKPGLWFSHPFLSAHLTKKWSLSTAILPSFPLVLLIPTSLPVSLSPLQVWPNFLQSTLHFLFLTWKASR